MLSDRLVIFICNQKQVNSPKTTTILIGFKEMKRQTEEFISQLQTIIEDEFFSLVGDNPYEVIAWEVEEKGDFSVENFLVANQGLIRFKTEVFLNHIRQTQSENTLKKYQNLILLLENNLSEFMIYGYRLLELPNFLLEDFLIVNNWFGDVGIPMLIGLSQGGEWIGLGIKQEQKYISPPAKMSFQELEIASESTAKLVEEIKKIVANIDHHTEAESELDISNYFEGVIALNRHEVMEKLLIATKFLNISKIENFLQGEISSEEKEIEDIEEEIGEIEEELKEETKPEIIEEKQEELQAAKEELAELKIKGGLGLKSFFDSQVNNSQVYNFDFLMEGEYSTIHIALGKTETGDAIGVATYTFTL